MEKDLASSGVLPTQGADRKKSKGAGQAAQGCREVPIWETLFHHLRPNHTLENAGIFLMSKTMYH